MKKESLIKTLKSMKSAEDTLKNFVIDDLLDKEDIKAFIEDVLKYGCISGIVSSLIYTKDCVKFYEKYKKEIGELIRDLGINPAKCFKNWEQDDPLILESYNKNILAWFGYEETLFYINEELYQLEEE